MFTIKNLKASLISNKNKSTFRKGSEVCFTSYIELNMLFTNGIYQGTCYFINGKESTKIEVKEFVKLYGVNNVRRLTIV